MATSPTASRHDDEGLDHTAGPEDCIGPLTGFKLAVEMYMIILCNTCVLHLPYIKPIINHLALKYYYFS